MYYQVIDTRLQELGTTWRSDGIVGGDLPQVVGEMALKRYEGEKMNTEWFKFN